MDNTNIEKKKGRGGARAGSGRKKDGRNQLSVGELLETLQAKAGGKSYEDLLVTDFLQARQANDTQLIIKYHNLILSKVMTNMAKIEVTDSAEAVEAKKIIFAEALSKLTGLQKD
jgi:hypothetical protein